MGLHNSEIANLERGLLERVFYCKDGRGGFCRPPQPLPGVFPTRLKKLSLFLKDWLIGSTPVTEHEFARMYKGRKLIMNTQAADSLMIESVRKRDSKTSVFVKAEKTIKDRPRIISPTSRRYLVASGRWIKPLEKPIVRGINAFFGEITIMKGLNADDSGKEFDRAWSQYAKPVAVMMDASAFDQHVSQQAMEWEHDVYLSAYNYPSELEKLLSWQRRPSGTGYCHDGKVRYKVDGTRTSGCINTGLGNCLIMCGLVWGWLQHVGITRCSVKNNGDDCALILDQKDLPVLLKGISEWFLEMGFNMVIEKPVYVLEQIVFCQTQPVYVNGAYRMVRQAPMSFAKDSVFIKPLNRPSIWKKMLEAVGKCGMSLTGGVPVCQDFYTAYIRTASAVSFARNRSRRVQQRRNRNRLLDDPSMETGMVNLAAGMDNTYTAPSDRTRVSFWLAFGITPDHQLHLEKSFQEANYLFGESPSNQHLPLVGW